MHICRVGYIFHSIKKKMKTLQGHYLSHMLQFLCFYITFMLCHLSEMGNSKCQQMCVECCNQLVKEDRKKTENVCPQLCCDAITYSLALQPSESFGLINYRHPSFFVHCLLCPSIQKHQINCSNPWLYFFTYTFYKFVMVPQYPKFWTPSITCPSITRSCPIFVIFVFVSKYFILFSFHMSLMMCLM